MSKQVLWPIVRLGNVCEIGAGNSAPQGDSYFENGKYPFVRMQDVGRCTSMYLEQTTDLINDQAVREKRLKLWPVNSLLFPKSGASIFLNHRALLAQPSYVVSHLAVIVPGKLLLPEFLYYYSLTIDAARIVPDTNYPSLRLTDVEAIKIPLPPLPEQRRIVAILRKADELRQLRRDMLSILNKLYGSVFYHSFGDGRPTTQFSSTKKLKSLLKVPLSSGYSPTASNIGTGIPVFTLSALTDTTIDSSAVKYYSVEEYSGKGDDLEVDDILISRSNTLELVGRVGRYQGKPDPVIYPDLMIRVRLKDPVDAPYLEGFLRSDFMKYTIRKFARGTSGSMKKISQGDINSFDVLWPPKDRRVKFGETIRAIDILRQNQCDSNETLNMLFTSLLARAFTGELTAAWREMHAEELAAAAAERDRLLGIKPKERPAVELIEEEIVERLQDSMQSLIPRISSGFLSGNRLLKEIEKSSFLQISQQLQAIAQVDDTLSTDIVTKSVQSFSYPLQQSLANSLAHIRQAQKVQIRAFISPLILTSAQQMFELANRVRDAYFERPDNSHPRYTAFQSMSDREFFIYRFIERTRNYVTVDSLVEEGGLSLAEARQDLQLLMSMGLIQAVNIPIDHPELGIIHVAAYRILKEEEETRLDDLQVLTEQLQ